MFIDDKEITITGRFIKTARLAQEWYEDVEEPESFIQKLRESKLKADIFTFWQRLPEIEPKYNYHMEYDPVAAMPITSFDHWWKKQISTNIRRAVKKSKKKGVVVKETKFNNDFIQGMVNIFNESPIRQGKPFWHYGKDFDTIKREFSRFIFREDMIGAYYKNALIGFIMLAHAGKYSITGQILSMIKHRDKATNNALIAKAVELCAKKKIPYLVYLFWGSGSLSEFKRRNGFEKIPLPRYYIPLTIKGKIAFKLNLHHGISGILPQAWKRRLKSFRNKMYSLINLSLFQFSWRKNKYRS